MRKKTKVILIFILIVLLAGGAVFAGIMIEKHTPSKEWMTAQEYFGASEGDVIFFYNHQRLSEPVLVVDGQVYMTHAFVFEYLNKRFYQDIYTGDVLYTTSETVYTFKKDSETYTDLEGNSYTESHPLLREWNGEAFLSLELVKKYADFQYAYYEEPSRLLLWDIYDTEEWVTVEKSTQMRFEAGIKSKIIRNAEAQEKLQVVGGPENGFLKLRSEDGFTGYVLQKHLSDSVFQKQTSEFVPEPRREGIRFSAKVNLVWHALGTSVGRKKVQEDLKNTKGINVISPTWYSITSAEGEVLSYANADYVKACHELGIMVWPLIDDFTKGLDGVALYSNAQTRKRLIDFILSESRKYEFDGINIDFEKVTAESAVHYLQFLRELSLACTKEKLVLSVDNYVPADYNLFYDRAEQACWADYIIVMGYDEHWAGSDAGSVASIGFVKKGIEDTLLEVPAEQIINAMPFYTRIWVETPQKNGTIETSSKAVGMKTAYDTIIKSGFPAIWDEDCAQYYCSYEYEEGDSVVKIWLEDGKSIEAKMELFAQYQLAGVAGWRLGFETPDIWDVILKYIS